MPEGYAVANVYLMNATTQPTESPASLFSALWSEFIAAKRAGHLEVAAKLKARLDAFDREVLGA